MIFDSHKPGGWNAVYMSAVAEQVADVDEGIEVFARPVGGARLARLDA